MRRRYISLLGVCQRAPADLVTTAWLRDIAAGRGAHGNAASKAVQAMPFGHAGVEAQRRVVLSRIRERR